MVTADGQVSDGHHTFEELYRYRLLYNAALFNEWAKLDKYDVHKSRFHHDGEFPFGDPTWFIVVAELPTGQISNHYRVRDWELFDIPSRDRPNVYDGHTPAVAADRLTRFLGLDTEEDDLVANLRAQNSRLVQERDKALQEVADAKAQGVAEYRHQVRANADKPSMYNDRLTELKEQRDTALAAVDEYKGLAVRHLSALARHQGLVTKVAELSDMVERLEQERDERQDDNRAALDKLTREKDQLAAEVTRLGERLYWAHSARNQAEERLQAIRQALPEQT